MSNNVIKRRKPLFGGIFENNVGIIGQFCENNRLKFWEILKRIIGKIKRIIGSCLTSAVIIVIVCLDIIDHARMYYTT